MIEPFAPADLDELLAFRDGLSPLDRRRFSALEALPELQADNYLAILVERAPQGRIIGYGHIERFRQGHKQHVGRLGVAVASQHRGQGIGDALLNALLGRAEADGLAKVWLSVHKDNHAAIRLYERHGFQLEGCFEDEERWPEPVAVLAMALPLPRQASATIPWSRPDVRSSEALGVLEVLRSGWLSQGPRTRDLEVAFRNYVGAPHAVALANGTACLYVLYATLFRPGDRVIMPALTFVSTVNAAALAGLEPVLADVEPGTGNIDLDCVEQLCRKDAGIRGVVVVDLAGQPVDLPRWREFCTAKGLTLVEDAAESIGAVCRGTRVGGFGHPTLFSLHAAKVVTSIEGGVVVTDDAGLAAALRSQRSHGEAAGKKWVYESVGLNFRMTDLQAAIGVAQLARLESFVRQRRVIMGLYRAELGTHLDFQEVVPTTTVHPFMMCLAKARERDGLARHLAARRIECRTILPIQYQPSWQQRFAGCRLPHSHTWAETGLCLPIYNDMKPEEAQRVIEAVRDYYGR